MSKRENQKEIKTQEKKETCLGKREKIKKIKRLWTGCNKGLGHCVMIGRHHYEGNKSRINIIHNRSMGDLDSGSKCNYHEEIDLTVSLHHGHECTCAHPHTFTYVRPPLLPSTPPPSPCTKNVNRNNHIRNARAPPHDGGCVRDGCIS